MSLRQRSFGFAAASAVFLVSAACSSALCQESHSPALQGATNGTIGPKGAIETRIESHVGGAVPYAASSRLFSAPKIVSGGLSSFGKGRIENPLERSFNGIRPAFRAGSAPAPQPALRRAVEVQSIAQRKERPGLVGWHESMTEACAASAKSGKPVLLVHVLGNLDQHFC